MKVSKAVKLCLEYHKSHSKENTVRAYRMALTQLCEEFGTENLEDITTERALSFLNRTTEGRKRQTKRTRYSHLLAFFNFIKNHIDPEFRNPCDTPMLKKLFRAKPSYNWNIIEKETVDEVIFRTSKPRNLGKVSDVEAMKWIDTLYAYRNIHISQFINDHPDSSL